jgi:hypothetical protein
MEGIGVRDLCFHSNVVWCRDLNSFRRKVSFISVLNVPFQEGLIMTQTTWIQGSCWMLCERKWSSWKWLNVGLARPLDCLNYCNSLCYLLEQLTQARLGYTIRSPGLRCRFTASHPGTNYSGNNHLDLPSRQNYKWGEWGVYVQNHWRNKASGKGAGSLAGNNSSTRLGDQTQPTCHQERCVWSIPDLVSHQQVRH